MDYVIISADSTQIVSVTEVKNDNIDQGIAQCAVQLESAIYVNEVNLNVEEEKTRKAFGVVTDAERFHFLKVLTANDGDTIRLEVSPQMTVGVIRSKIFLEILYGGGETYKYEVVVDPQPGSDSCSLSICFDSVYPDVKHCSSTECI